MEYTAHHTLMLVMYETILGFSSLISKYSVRFNMYSPLLITVLYTIIITFAKACFSNLSNYFGTLCNNFIVKFTTSLFMADFISIFILLSIPFFQIQNGLFKPQLPCWVPPICPRGCKWNSNEAVQLQVCWGIALVGWHRFHCDFSWHRNLCQPGDDFDRRIQHAMQNPRHGFDKGFSTLQLSQRRLWVRLSYTSSFRCSSVLTSSLRPSAISIIHDGYEHAEASHLMVSGSVIGQPRHLSSSRSSAHRLSHRSVQLLSCAPIMPRTFDLQVIQRLCTLLMVDWITYLKHTLCHLDAEGCSELKVSLGPHRLTYS